jgi:hypothetical protein
MTESGLMLAALMSAPLFWIGAGSVSIPVLIHLLSRRRFKRVRWAAIAFLLQADRENRRRVRLQEWILLLLRCLAMLLLGLLLSRPFVQPTGLAAMVGADRRHERVFLLDDSFSMGAGQSGQNALERGKAQINRLLDWLHDEAPQDRVTLWLSSQPAEPVVPGQFIDTVHLQEIRDWLSGVTTSASALTLERAIPAVRDWLTTLSGEANVVLYVISDFRRPDWALDGPDAGAVRDLRELATSPEDARSVELMFVDVGAALDHNLAITGLTMTKGKAVLGLPAGFDVQLTNFGDGPVEGAEIRLYADEVTQPARKAGRLDPGQSITTTLEAAFIHEGGGNLRAELAGGDALRIDNVRHLGVPVSPAMPILIVDGDPNPDAYADEVALLRTALRPEGEAFSGNEVTVVDEAQFEQTELSRFDLVVLANVYRPSADAVEALERFTSAGGGVLVFLGEHIDPEGYNSLMYRGGEGLLPAGLGDRVAAPPGSAGTGLMTKGLTHPAVRAFSAAPELFASVRVWGFFDVQLEAENPNEPQDSAEKSESTTPGEGEGRSPARVALRYQDEAGSVAVIERSYGRGRVMLVTTTCDRDWTNWPEQPSYVVAMLELAQFLGKSTSGFGQVAVAEPIRLNVPAELFQSEAVVKSPSYPSRAEVELRGTPAPETGQLVFVWEDTLEPGPYRFELRRRGGDATDRIVSVNVDPRESDLKKLSEAEVRQALPGVEFQYVTSSGEFEKRSDIGRRELWPTMLVLAVFALMLEQGLAWWFGRQT